MWSLSTSILPLDDFMGSMKTGRVRGFRCGRSSRENPALPPHLWPRGFYRFGFRATRTGISCFPFLAWLAVVPASSFIAPIASPSFSRRIYG